MLVRFAQSKHIFSWVILASLVFGMLAPVASGLALAQATNPNQNAQSGGSSNPNAAESKATTSKEAGSGETGWIACIQSPLDCAGVSIMHGLRNLFVWVAGYAAALFVWVVSPANMSGPTGIMNTPAIYEMWKFVRDFFNLFFILILLLSAFATVFQVENFSIRKIFLNVLFAALIINFSFPITRFLIDLTNVPMYYFLNAILPGYPGGEGFARLFLSSTGLGAIPFGADGVFIRATMEMVFAFLLSISLLVLGVMFLIRLIALTLLLIFSPFGFAAALMPGFQKLGQEWWGKFWSYAFFGPAAALVLLVAIRFMESVSVGGVYIRLKETTTNMTAGSPEANSMATMLYYLIPIILIWTAIGMANRFSIAGAGKVVGWGESFSRWTAKKAGKGMLGGAKLVLPTNTAKGMYAGAKEGLKGGKLFGKPIIPKVLSPKAFKQRAEDTEAKWKGRLKDGMGGKGGNELKKLQLKRQYESAEEMKKNNVSDGELRKTLDTGDANSKAAAAMVLTDRKAIKSADDFEKALDALGDNTKEISELIDKAGDGVMDNLNVNQYKKVAAVEAAAVRAGYNPEIQKQLNARLVKEGDSKVLVDYEIDTVTGGAPATATAAQMEAAVRKVLTPMKSARDVAKQEGLFNDPNYQSWAQFVIASRTPDQILQIKKASAEDGTSVGALI